MVRTSTTSRTKPPVQYVRCIVQYYSRALSMGLFLGKCGDGIKHGSHSVKNVNGMRYERLRVVVKPYWHSSKK